MKIRLTDIFLAVLSGILTGLAFPKFYFSFFIWISLIPLLFIISKKSPKQAFLLGLIAGFSFYVLLLYWIPAVPAHYGNLSVGISGIIYIILILFLSLFWAFFSLIFSKIYQSFPIFIFFLAPFIWISFEYILTFFLTGFPWGLLGYAQYKNIYFIQMTSCTGIYGLSFILVLFQSLFILSMKSRKKSYFFAGLILIILIHMGGFVSIKKISPSQDLDSFSASVIQGNVSSDIRWDEISIEEIRTLFERHLILSHQAYLKGSQLIIWPEFSVPLCFSCPYGIYQEFKESLFQFAEKTGCTLLLGTNETSRTGENVQYFNTVLCLSPDRSSSQYYKIHLVPFGEYTPYKKIFSFIEKMTHAIGELTPGTQHHLHEYDGISFGSPICYEIIFPNLVRKFIKNGGNFLVTITNDGWYGKSSAPYQHFSIAVIRAVENRRFLLRAATTGISGIIDPYGRILSQSELETETFLTESITPSQTRTLYTKYGDILPIAGLTLSGVFLILALIKRKNEKQNIRSKRESF